MLSSLNTENAKCDLGTCVMKWKRHQFRNRKIWFERGFAKYIALGQVLSCIWNLVYFLYGMGLRVPVLSCVLRV